MFETSSALFSIADDDEFRFARFYIVCEAVPLGTLGNPLIVCGLSDTFRGVFKAWQRHGIRCPARCGRNAHILLQRTAAGKFHPEHFTILFLPVPAFLRRVPGIHRGFCTAMIRRPPAPREPVSGRHRRQPGCRLKDRCLHFRCGSLSAVRPNS